jgi:predicted DNA-binding antitoxin AbrB/MazE fold protein
MSDKLGPGCEAIILPEGEKCKIVSVNRKVFGKTNTVIKTEDGELRDVYWTFLRTPEEFAAAQAKVSTLNFGH